MLVLGDTAVCACRGDTVVCACRGDTAVCACRGDTAVCLYGVTLVRACRVTLLCVLVG